MTAAERVDLLAIGEAMVEFNQTDAGRPNYLQGYGGDTSNVAIAAARQGARSAYVTRVGDDAFGRMLLDLWRREGVDAHAVAVDPEAPTGIYFVTHGERGHEFSYRRAGSAASRMRPDDMPLQTIRAARFVQASGISLAISDSAGASVLHAFAEARAAGAKVVLDTNLRLALWPLARAREMIGAAAALADYCFPSLDDATVLSGLDDRDAIVDWLHRLGVRNVLLKLGGEGVLVSDGARRETIGGLRVDVVDATGAGDCFCGACVARLAAGDTLWEAARYANAAAALSTTGYGAVAAQPNEAEVRRLLAS